MDSHERNTPNIHRDDNFYSDLNSFFYINCLNFQCLYMVSNGINDTNDGIRDKYIRRNIKSMSDIKANSQD